MLDLLEIQSEATTGMRYVKSEVAQPVSVTYILGGECWLLLDLPQGASKAISLVNIYDVKTIRDASYAVMDQDTHVGLVLPREVVKLLKAWRVFAQEKLLIPSTSLASIDLRWEDTVNDFTEEIDLEVRGDQEMMSVAKPAIGSCPFKLPDGFVPAFEFKTDGVDKNGLDCLASLGL